MATDEPGPERHINIHFAPEIMAGVYANFANVSHSDYEFTLPFARVDHEVEDEEIPGVVVTRVNLSPRFMRELIDAMEDNYSKWRTREGIKSLPEYGGPPSPPADPQPRTARRPPVAARGPDALNATAAPMRCTVVGWVPNSVCDQAGGSGSETFWTVIR